MSHRWRLLFRPIAAPPDKVRLQLVQAMCILHNYLRTANDVSYHPPGFTDEITPDGRILEGYWRPAPLLLSSLDTYSSRNSTAQAAHIRQYFAKYFSTIGSVDWQLEHIHAR